MLANTGPFQALGKLLDEVVLSLDEDVLFNILNDPEIDDESAKLFDKKHEEFDANRCVDLGDYFMSISSLQKDVTAGKLTEEQYYDLEILLRGKCPTLLWEDRHGPDLEPLEGAQIQGNDEWFIFGGDVGWNPLDDLDSCIGWHPIED